MTSYKTVAGDTFDWIAYKVLGSCRYTQALIDANRQYVDTYVFNAGVALTIPDVENESRTSKLPPWRK